MINRLKVMDILRNPVDFGFTLTEDLYRIPCLKLMQTSKCMYENATFNHEIRIAFSK